MKTVKIPIEIIQQYGGNESMTFLENDEVNLKITTLNGKFNIITNKIYEDVPVKSWKECLRKNLLSEIIFCIIFIILLFLVSYLMVIILPEYKGTVYKDIKDPENT